MDDINWLRTMRETMERLDDEDYRGARNGPYRRLNMNDRGEQLLHQSIVDATEFFMNGP